ncbi:MAG: hypothetical protein KF716_04140 [Anaerolineae bacterium]|nr:hypothetical protein [Anaerolineae bacterium]
MMKTKWLIIILLLVMIGSPQHISAQRSRQKIFEVDGMIYGGFIWSSDSRWIGIYIDDKDNPYYDRITQTLQRERPQALIDTRTISAEEHAFFRVADNVNVSISPNGRYLLYDSSDPLPPPDSENEKIDREVMKLRPTYLADRQQRTYTLWRITGGLSSTWWSDNSSGVFVRVNGWESIGGLVGYVTGFQEDVTQFRDMDVSEFMAQDKHYFYYELIQTY